MTPLVPVSPWLQSLPRLALALMMASIATSILAYVYTSKFLYEKIQPKFSTLIYIALIAGFAGAVVPLIAWAIGLPITTIFGITPLALSLISGVSCMGLAMLAPATPYIALVFNALHKYLILKPFEKFPILNKSFNLFLVASTVAAAVSVAVTQLPTLAIVLAAFGIAATISYYSKGIFMAALKGAVIVFAITASATFISGVALLPLPAFMLAMSPISIALATGGIAAALVFSVTILPVVLTKLGLSALKGTVNRMPVINPKSLANFDLDTVAFILALFPMLAPAIAVLPHMQFSFVIGGIAVGSYVVLVVIAAGATAVSNRFSPSTPGDGSGDPGVDAKGSENGAAVTSALDLNLESGKPPLKVDNDKDEEDEDDQTKVEQENKEGKEQKNVPPPPKDSDEKLLEF